MYSWRNHTSLVSIGNPARSLSNTGGGICKRSNTGERRAKIIQILSSDVVSVFNFFLKHEVQEWEKAARNSSNKSLYQSPQHSRGGLCAVAVLGEDSPSSCTGVLSPCLGLLTNWSGCVHRNWIQGWPF